MLWADRYRSTVRAFLQRLGTHRGARLDDSDGGWSDEQDLLEERIDRVRDLRDFRFQVLELNAGAYEEQVADIFVRTNSEGVQLKQADFILTLMSVHWEKGRRQLEQFCRHAVDRTVTGPHRRTLSSTRARTNCCEPEWAWRSDVAGSDTSTTSCEARTSRPARCPRLAAQHSSRPWSTPKTKSLTSATGTSSSSASAMRDSAAAA